MEHLLERITITTNASSTYLWIKPNGVSLDIVTKLKTALTEGTNIQSNFITISETDEGEVVVNSRTFEILLGMLISNRSSNLIYTLKIPPGVVERLAHHSSKLFIERGRLWTRRGILTFPIKTRAGELTIVGSDSSFKIHLNGNELKVGSRFEDKLSLLSDTILSSLPYQDITHARISYLTDLFDVDAGKYIEELDKFVKQRDSAMVKDGKTPYRPDVIIPIPSLVGICYMGKGMIGNIETGEVTAPTTVDGELVYMVNGFMGVKDNIIRLPFDKMQDFIYGTPQIVTPDITSNDWYVRDGVRGMVTKTDCRIQWWIAK